MRQLLKLSKPFVIYPGTPLYPKKKTTSTYTFLKIDGQDIWANAYDKGYTEPRACYSRLYFWRLTPDGPTLEELGISLDTFRNE